MHYEINDYLSSCLRSCLDLSTCSHGFFKKKRDLPLVESVRQYSDGAHKELSSRQIVRDKFSSAPSSVKKMENTSINI